MLIVLLRFPDRVLGNEMDNFKLNITLYEEFNNPKNMLDAVKPLSKISSGDVTTNVNITTIPSTLVLTGNNLFPSMLAALRQANNYLRELKENIHTTCMKTIMSYMILHLTLEYAVVPRLQEAELEQSS